MLLADGDPVETAMGGALDFSAARPAAYRAEVFVPGAPGAPPIPWIVSNPIYVGPAATPAPVPAMPDGALRSLDIGAWVLEHDTRSTASIDHLADRVLLDYELVGPAPASAAVVLSLQDVSDALDGIAFEVRADRPTRASVQLRVDDGSGGLRWRRSFYADETTRTIEMRFADLIPTTRDLTTAPSLSSATSLLVAVDALHTLLGVPGRLTVISPRLVGSR